MAFNHSNNVQKQRRPQNRKSKAAAATAFVAKELMELFHFNNKTQTENEHIWGFHFTSNKIVLVKACKFHEVQKLFKEWSNYKLFNTNCTFLYLVPFYNRILVSSCLFTIF